MFKRLTLYIKRNRPEVNLLLIIITVSALAHGINMFRFPYIENDEGVYMSQAWSLITEGKLAPYTYWYDHAPGGWFFIALWAKLTGGFFTFGLSAYSGRVFMLVLHVLSTVFLYFIARKLTASKLAGFVSALVFSLSPLGIYFQRRVLLDNILVFWVLLSFLLLLKNKLKISTVILSGLAFGIAVLSKESAIFFIPVFLYLIFIASSNLNRSFNIVKWLSVSFLVISFYFLYALLKKEFLPVGFMGDMTPHVSLIATLKEQYSRGGGGIIDMQKSAFWKNFFLWTGEDPLIMYFGALATFVNLILGIRYINMRVASLLALSYWFFLMRGGLVIEFYVIPLIPLLGLNIGMLVWFLKDKIYQIHPGKQFSLAARTITGILIAVIVVSSLYYSTNVRGDKNIFTSDQVKPQVEALDWILARQDPNAFYVIDNYGYVDLQAKSNNNFKNAEWYWKVDRDPDINLKLLENDPGRIGYIALTPQMEHDMTAAGLKLTDAAWHNSTPIKRFWNDGWGVEFWGTKYPDRILLSSWDYYKTKFIVNGAVKDPALNNTVTSEGQAYALLRSVWMDDRQTFNDVLGWSESNLKVDTGLYAWKWKDGSKVDAGTASDADADIALALLFAGKKWGSEDYLTRGKELLDSIWKNEVATVDGQNYLVAGNWANSDSSLTLNPSYFSPSHYRIFAEADSSHDWNSLVKSSYRSLEECTRANLDKDIGRLPPEWCALDKKSLVFRVADQNQPNATFYSFNAVRVPWRIGLDYAWFKSSDAYDYLKTLSFLGDEYRDKGKIITAYQHDGSPWENYESALGYSGSLGYFKTVDPATATNIYNTKLLSKYFESDNGSYWEDENNYYTQNWAWFATALYNDRLPNLWK